MLVHAFLALRVAQTDCQIPLRIIRLLVGRVCEMVGQQQEARAAASGMCFGKKPFQSFILFVASILLTCVQMTESNCYLS